jgi:hypothetical protein
VNWKWIGILSCVSIVIALLSVFGVLPEGGMGYVISFAIAAAMAFVFARNTTGKFFRNGLMLGLVTGLVSTLVQMVFLTTMLENNPKMAQQFEQMPAGMNPAVGFAMFAPIGILMSALIMGLFTWIVAMLMGKGSRRTTPPPMPV